jgi:type VI secretion system protein ImpL
VGESDRQVIAGSHVVSGAFTREAWEGYVRDAIKDAAHQSLQSTDWVLKTATSDDLTLEGSPEQIQKSLTQLYKAEYAQQWGRFIQGITVLDFQGFEQAVQRMQRLGDPVQSPIGLLLQTLQDQTAWDNPSMLNDRLAKGQQGLIGWFKNTVLGMNPTPVQVTLSAEQLRAAEVPTGPIGKAFAGVNRLMLPREGGQTLTRVYLDALSRVRARLNQMKTQGDPGPGARQFMQQTLEGTGELAEALKLVDEQLLTGLDEGARNALRPILVRPLMQAFAALVPPTEAELNRVWNAQVFEPYQRTLASKYPFDRGSRMEATQVELAAIFGTEGAVAKYLEQSLGALVLRRGDQLTPRTWADMGVRLRPAFASGLGTWVAPLGGQGAGASGAGHGTEAAQTSFQVLPQPAPGLTEYTIEIDGQVLRYRQGTANWQPFVWPGPGTPGVRITGVTFDGRQLSFFNEPGHFGLEKMINAAQRRRVDGQVFELKCPQSNVAVAVQLRILSNSAPAAQPASAGEPGARPTALPALVAGSDEAPPTALAVPTVPARPPVPATAALPIAPAPARQGEVIAAGEGA